MKKFQMREKKLLIIRDTTAHRLLNHYCYYGWGRDRSVVFELRGMDGKNRVARSSVGKFTEKSKIRNVRDDRAGQPFIVLF